MLEPRLQAVADQIRSRVHADIGSDHALLPKYLLKERRVERVIVVEKNRQPFENARAALEGLDAEVRLGDGLAPLNAGEAESLSMSGMGALLMVRILCAHPWKLPEKVVLQPNDSAEPIRVWARDHGFHLSCEQMVEGFWRYNVLTLVRGIGDDPAYEGLPLEPKAGSSSLEPKAGSSSLEAALRYGPLLLKQRHPLLLEELQREKVYLEGLLEKKPVLKLQRQLELTLRALGYYDSSGTLLVPDS